jgi:hypothetical protein
MSDLLDHAAAIRSGEELDLAKLEPYLRFQFPNETGALQVRQYPCGHSNLTYASQPLFIKGLYFFFNFFYFFFIFCG